MYPTLSDMIRDLFGLDIPLPFPTFGFLVALAFLTGAYLFTLELKRKEKIGWLKSHKVKMTVGEKATTGEIFWNAVVGFIIGFKLVEIFLNYSDLVKDPQDFIFSSRGNLLGGIIAAAIFAFLKYREKEKKKLPQPKLVEETIHPYELVGNMTMIAAITGILGAKIFHNLENIDQFMADPWGSLVSFSGLSIYGGLILGGISVLWYASKHGLKWIHVADASAPGLMAAYAVGRVGCQLAGDGDWGQPNDLPKPDWLSWAPDWMWSFDYPGNVLGINLQEEFHQMGLESITGRAWPTPFYETIMATVIFLVLWSLRKRIKIPGFIFSLYLSLNGLERYFIEKIRINPDYHFWGINATQAELIASLLFFVGMFGMIYFSKNKTKFLPNTALT